MGDRHGTSVDLVGRYDVLSTKTDLVEVAAGVNFGSSTQNQTFFGVTKAQSANSGNAVYKADAGITGTGVGVTWRHSINQNCKPFNKNYILGRPSTRDQHFFSWVAIESKLKIFYLINVIFKNLIDGQSSRYQVKVKNL